MPIFDHFDFLAPYYDRVISVPDTKYLEALLELPVDGALLDAGGGTGRIAQTLIDKAAEVFLVDSSVGMLQQAAGKGRISKICSYSEILPFEDGSFDRIIMIDAFHHVCNQEETASELWRVLKSGGKLIIEEPDITKFVVKIVAVAEKIALMRSHFINPESIAAMFSYDSARTSIFQENVNAWVVVEKK